MFINVCDHDSIPTTDKKRGKNRYLVASWPVICSISFLKSVCHCHSLLRWPIFVLSPSFKISVDKNAEECHVLGMMILIHQA